LKLIRFIPAIGWFVLSLILLCLPGSTIPKYPWLAKVYADKWIHIALFFTLCYLFSRPFRNSAMDRFQRYRWFLWITLAGIAYGTAMEFVQKYWVANRSFELWDIVADSTGCLAAWWYSRRKFDRPGGS
jgi:VanZ family protein